AGLCLPGRDLRAREPSSSGSTGSWLGAPGPNAHSFDHLGSASSAGPPHLARPLWRVADLSVVVLATSASVLGRLLSSPTPSQSRMSVGGLWLVWWPGVP